MNADQPKYPEPSPTAAAATPGKSWQEGLAPSYITLFLSVVYFDRLAPQTLGVGGLGPSLLGALAGGVLCYALLYLPPASWGLGARQPLTGLLPHTFGRVGSRRVATPILALAQLGWFAIAIAYAADLSLRGLALLGILGPEDLEPAQLGGIRLGGGWAYLATTLIWMPTAGVLGPLLGHLVAAVLRAYVVAPAALLGLTMLWALGGLSGGVPPPRWDSPAAPLTMIQLVFGFFATFGAAAADWGAASRDRRDVRLGGAVGVALASTIIAAVALVTVAGTVGRIDPARRDPTALLYQATWTRGVGERAGGVLALVFTLALLGPACHAPTVAVRAITGAWPGLRRWAVGLAFAVLAWPLAAGGPALRLELMFGLLGALMAPLVGVLSADAFMSRGEWAGPRPGTHWPAVVGWVMGAVVGLIPYAGPWLGIDGLARVQPAAVLAYVTAFAAFRISGGLPPGPPDPAIDPGE
jgi:cytosine/uracil/thiamine/allantoin permease